MGKCHPFCSLCMIFQQSQGKVHQSGLGVSRMFLMSTDTETVISRRKNIRFYIMHKISMYCWHLWSTTVFQTWVTQWIKFSLRWKQLLPPVFYFYSCISLKLQSTGSSICSTEETGILTESMQEADFCYIL